MSHPPSVPIPLGGTLSVHPPPKVPMLQGKTSSKGKGRRHGERCWFLPAKGPARSGWAGDGARSPGLATENPSEAADNHNPAAPRAGEQSGWVRVLCAVSHLKFRERQLFPVPSPDFWGQNGVAEVQTMLGASLQASSQDPVSFKRIFFNLCPQTHPFLKQHCLRLPPPKMNLCKVQLGTGSLK